MALITWTEEQFGTKISTADEQHQELFDLLNTLHETIPGGDREEISKQLDGFLDYVAMHFQTEEELLQKNGYPDFEAHKAEHEKLLTTAAEIQKGFKEEGKDLSQDSTAFVKDWLTNHIPTIDKAYGPFLNEKGIS
jgi:hemerythrin